MDIKSEAFPRVSALGQQLGGRASSVTKGQLEIIAPALFTFTGTEGVYAGTALFEQVIDGLSSLISRYRTAKTEVLRFPPVISRRQLEVSGYLQSFPHLLGVVSCLRGTEAEIVNLVETADWVSGLSASELVLAPAACYPLYPMAAARGSLPKEGLLFDTAAYCFRHELTYEIDRFQAFRMREYVCMGTAEQVLGFRSNWISRAEDIAGQLCLPCKIVPATDPFFGRTGRIAAVNQLEQSLKYELAIPIRSKEKPTACMSFNYHRDHFGDAWGLRTAEGEKAHTACVAFGLDRLALAVFATYGIDVQQWPAVIRDRLGMDRSSE
jgi:seryl-tRNA synthetase